MVTLASFREMDADLWRDAFASTGDATVEAALEVAATIHAVSDFATLYLTAHLLTQLSQTVGSESGEVTAQHAGPLFAAYKSQAERHRDTFFTTSIYGKTYLALAQTAPRSAIGAFVAG